MKALEDFKENVRKLAVSIYIGDRLERNLKIITWIGFVIALVSGIMTGINIVQQKGFVIYTTAVACACGIFITFSGLVLKKRRPAILAALFVCIFIFTYYTLFGVNDGFAILWTFLVPLAFSYFAGVIFGVSLSVYYEVLFIVLFYTPIRETMGEFYTETFMDRYPMLYLCGVLLNCVAMVHYHVTTLAQIEYEKKLEDAANEAISAGKAKSQFLAQMSHEIRTPINTILGMNEMILREAKDESVLDYSGSIQEAGRTLLSLINSILDFSKIEDGKMEILPVKYNTENLIHGLVSSVSERARAKELDFIVEIDDKLPKVLLGDDVRVSQVIVNLLTNAVKYTESGSVTLIMREKERTDHRIRLFVCVKDTGIGIKEEDHEKLFASFERLDEERNRNIEGTGLGMAIVIKLLAMMGSEIKLKSIYGKGSAFSFELWQEIVDETPMGSFSMKPQRIQEETEEKYLYAPDAKVLVTDDNEMNLKVITHLMRRCGIKPDLANSGRETIEKVRKNSYDILLLDHMMPRMDGIETLQTLRKEELLRPDMTVIALTANAVVGAKESYLSAGFQDYLSKPISVKALEEALAKYLPEGSYSWRVKDGKAEERPVTQKKAEKTETQKEEPMERTPLKDDDHLDEGEIFEFAPMDENVVLTEGNLANQGGVFEKLENFGLAVQDGLTYCGGEEAFYLEILRDYVTGHEERKRELQQCFDGKDWKQYRIKIHSLKSASKTIGSMKLFGAAKDLEEAVNHENIPFLEERHSGFMKEYDGVVEALAGILK